MPAPAQALCLGFSSDLSDRRRRAGALIVEAEIKLPWGRLWLSSGSGMGTCFMPSASVS